MYHDQERGMVEGRGGGRGGRGGDVPIHKTGVENSNLTSNDKPVCQPVSISLLPPSPLSFNLFFHQGNLRFSKGERDELVIENGEELKVIASLLGSTPDMAEKALCYRVVGNKLGAVEKEHTLEQALYGRDALAKVCVGGGGWENGEGGGVGVTV